MSAPGELIANRYRLEKLLGSGGMGVVWEAWDERLERRVAVKQLHAVRGLSPAEAELANSRAMREARINARLHHRYAVPIFDVAEHDGQPCLVMQFVPSIPLSDVLRESGPLEPAEAARVGAQVGSALAAAHEVGIVHRDVKPGNILIADDGAALISDFGISQAMGDVTLTQAGMVHGTPAYLAPEVARGGAASPASDVYSLGATLYAALEGAPPFGTDPNPIAVLHRVATGDFAPPVRGGALTPLLLAMLSTDPAARPAMADVARQCAAPGPPTGATRIVGSDPTVVLTSAGPPPAPAPLQAATPTTVRPAAGPPPAGPVSGGGAGADDEPPGRSGPEPRRRTALVAVVAVLLVALVASLISYAVFRPPAATTADPPVVAATPSEATTPSAPSPSPSASSASSSPTPTPSVTPTPSATPTPTTPTPSPPANRGEPTAAELTQVISTYYSLVPGDTDGAWPLLTASYQRSPSGGRASYERFWGAISKVSVSNLSANPPGTATATVTYTFKDGRTSRERTRFRLVTDDGKLKINGSGVVSGG